MKTTTSKTIGIIFLASVLAACGGGGGGGNAAANPDTPPAGQNPDTGDNPAEPPVNEPNRAPTASIVFPPASSVTDSDSIIVRGTAEDADGDTISLLRVNGVDAVSDDGFATWQVELPLVFGVNELVVEIEDDTENSDLSAASVSVTMQPEFLNRIDGAVFDTVGQQILVLEDALRAIFAVDVATGERSLVSGGGRGTGPELQNLSSVALDDEGRCAVVLAGATRCALVLNDAIDTVLAIDLETGDRAILSGEGRGAGPEFSLVQRITMNTDTDCSAVLPAATHCALVTDRGLQALFAVDLDTGDRAILSAAGRGTGPALVNPTTITLDPNNVCDSVLNGVVNCVLVVNSFNSSVLAVDLDTGNRAVLSGATRGSGPALDSSRSLAIDAGNSCAAVLPGTIDCALVINGINSFPEQKVLAVNLATGDRADLSHNELGQGPQLRTPESILTGIIPGKALVTDELYDALLTVDLSTGDRGLFPNHGNGTGPDLDSPVALLPVSGEVCNQVLDNNPPVNRCAVTVDSGRGVILAIDLDTANRANIASDERGNGVALGFPVAMALAGEALCSAELPGATHCAVITDASLKALLLVDLEAGDRVLLSGETLGSGPALVSPVAVTLPADCGTSNPCALVTDQSLEAIVRIDLATGDRVIVSDEETGSGPAFDLPVAVLELGDCSGLLAGVERCALVADADARALLAVDLQTGNRAVVSGGAEAVASRGNGPELEGPLTMVFADNARCAPVLDTVSRCLLVSNAAGTFGNEGELMAVDIDTGNRGLLLDNNAGRGPALPLSRAFFLDDEPNLGVSVDPAFKALQVLDLVTGERVVTAWSGKKQLVFLRGT